MGMLEEKREGELYPWEMVFFEVSNGNTLHTQGRAIEKEHRILRRMLSVEFRLGIYRHRTRKTDQGGGPCPGRRKKGTKEITEQLSGQYQAMPRPSRPSWPSPAALPFLRSYVSTTYNIETDEHTDFSIKLGVVEVLDDIQDRFARAIPDISKDRPPLSLWYPFVIHSVLCTCMHACTHIYTYVDLGTSKWGGFGNSMEDRALSMGH